MPLPLAAADPSHCLGDGAVPVGNLYEASAPVRSLAIDIYG